MCQPSSTIYKLPFFFSLFRIVYLCEQHGIYSDNPRLRGKAGHPGEDPLETSSEGEC